MTVRVERRDAVWTVVLDRPETRNAVDRDTAEALAGAFRAFDADPGAAVAVLWGPGDVLLRGRPQGRRRRARQPGRSRRGRAARADPDAAVQARDRGGVGARRRRGLELAIWCDLRVVEEDAIFGVYCRRWGVPLVDGGTVRLPRLIGTGRALDLILTGRGVDAAEAHRIGLADRVVPVGTARAAAEQLAAAMAALPQECLRNDRMSVYEALGRDVEDGMRVELAFGLRSLAGGAREGAARFAGGEGRHGAGLG
ncbi:crotonase/enoyl-CoA hydratase family protein [Dactylosporangium darangshiense]|uniref:crotonase/enoyl-CoA hydratase family protein n=1 Tax=Dactylosporangium darangshiense TaxID=579108 RepID=UPI00362B5998